MNDLNINKAHRHYDRLCRRSSYAVNLLLNHCPFSRTALILVHFQISERDQT